MITGRIVNFRVRPKRRHARELIVKFGGSPAASARLVGKEVLVEDGYGDRYSGRVLKPHGRSGACIVRFKKDVPGQVLGLSVRVFERLLSLSCNELSYLRHGYEPRKRRGLQDWDALNRAFQHKL